MSQLRGTAAVGRIEDLDAPQQLAVFGFRKWCDDGESGLSRYFTPATSAQLAALWDLCRHAGRRPLACHGKNCACLGADEAALATLVACARNGEDEDALMLAMLLVRADHAPALVAAARSTGLALCRQCLHDHRGEILH